MAGAATTAVVTMSDFATAAAVIAAGVPFAVVMVSAEESFAGNKVSGQIRTDSIFDRPFGPTDDLDAVLGQGVDRAAANAAADQHVDPFAGKQSGKSAMSGISARNDTGRDDLSAFAIIDGELRGVSEMLKDESVFTGHGDFHSSSLVLERFGCS